MVSTLGPVRDVCAQESILFGGSLEPVLNSEGFHSVDMTRADWEPCNLASENAKDCLLYALSEHGINTSQTVFSEAEFSSLVNVKDCVTTVSSQPDINITRTIISKTVCTTANLAPPVTVTLLGFSRGWALDGIRLWTPEGYGASAVASFSSWEVSWAHPVHYKLWIIVTVAVYDSVELLPQFLLLYFCSHFFWPK